jgi:hypothetical protein
MYGYYLYSTRTLVLTPKVMTAFPIYSPLQTRKMPLIPRILSPVCVHEVGTLAS